MPVIGRVSNGGSSDLAIDYALGKNKKMKNNTVEWLKENGINPNEIDFVNSVHNSRAVVAGGTNGISGLDAKEMFSLNQKIHKQTKKRNQVKRIVQSFSHEDLDPLNPENWQKANDIGVEFAKKAYPEYECAVFTQLDNENHLIHNHIDVDKVNLKTGKKLKEPKRIDDYRKINDELAKKYGMEVIPPKREKTLNAEKIHGRKAYVAYVKETVDEIMLNSEINSKQDFIKALDRADIIYTDENEINRFVSKTVKNKSGKPLVVRGKTLGTDYEKEVINHELDARKRDSKIEAREPKFERTVERTREIVRNYSQSEADKRTAESDQQDAQTRKQQAEADNQQADVQQSKINEIFANLEYQANKFRNRLGRLGLKIKRFFKQDTSNEVDKQDTNNEVDKQAQNQPTKPIELDKYGLNKDQRLMIDAGNKILRERGHELGELQLGYNGQTLRETDAEKNYEVAKPLKLTKGQLDTLVDANEEYSRTGLPRYEVLATGLSYNYNVKFKRFQEKQKLAENQVAQQQQPKKKPVLRQSKRLKIEHHTQSQQQNRKGPSM